MAATLDLYTSEYGWVMGLPPGWAPLPASAGPVLATHRPVVFTSDEEEDLSLTWMIAGHPMKEDVSERFVSVLAVEHPDREDLMSVAATIFPTIGTVSACEAVELADGSRALEVIESYLDGGESHGGYQLIFPVANVSNYPQAFQRLCFYAPAGRFADLLPAVRAAARSFRYTRPYGWKRAVAERTP